MTVAGQVCGFPQGQGQAVASRKVGRCPEYGMITRLGVPSTEAQQGQPPPAPSAKGTAAGSAGFVRRCFALPTTTRSDRYQLLHSTRPDRPGSRPKCCFPYEASSQAVYLHMGRDLHSGLSATPPPLAKRRGLRGEQGVEATYCAPQRCLCRYRWRTKWRRLRGSSESQRD